MRSHALLLGLVLAAACGGDGGGNPGDAASDGGGGPQDGGGGPRDGGGGACHANADCDDRVACTRDICDTSSSTCVNVPDGPDCHAPACTTNAECDDGASCTRDICDTDQGMCVHVASGPDCHPPECAHNADCDDRVDCTSDICDAEAGQCVHTPVGDTCMTTTGCMADSDCDDHVPCTRDRCDAGRCTAVADDTLCMADMCMDMARCDLVRGCVADVRGCDDGVGCTTDGCNPSTGCTHTANDTLCLAGETCNAASGCAGGSCGNDAACDDANACTTDHCVGGRCEHAARPPCDDGNPCTDDMCDTRTGMCVTSNNTRLCDDRMTCTTGDACMGGSCVATPVTCDDRNPCTSDACDSGTGSCRYSPMTNAPCDDGNACTTGTVCQASGACGGGTGCPDDGNPCTTDGCGPSGCTSTPSADGTGCGGSRACCGGGCVDRNLDPNNCGMCGTHCTGSTSACVSGACRACTMDSQCDDGLACTTDRCSTNRCNHSPSPGFCFIGGLCYSLGDVNPANPCEQCTPTFNPLSWTGRPGQACNDGLYCTTGETCNASGVCGSPTANPCTDSLSCNTDLCDETTDSCTHPINSGWCVLGGECRAEGSSNSPDPDNRSCMKCDPTMSQTDWSPRNNGCFCITAVYTGTCMDTICTPVPPPMTEPPGCLHP